MKSATRVVLSTMGVIAGLAGIEHGIGEVLQGNTAPDSIMILSWPDSAFFQILAGEPAMTIIPSYLMSGLLSIIFSVALMLWAILVVQRKHGGIVLILLSGVLLIVGGGFGPPMLGLILGAAAATFAGWPVHIPVRSRQFLAKLWRWSFGLCLSTWVFLLPGLPLLDHVFGVRLPDAMVYAVALSAFGSLLLALLTSYAFDVQKGVQLARSAQKDLTHAYSS